MEKSRLDVPNIICGALFIAFGIFFFVELQELSMGTATKMGPGYFPTVVSVILIVLGAIIAVSALRSQGEPVGQIAWRGMLFILSSPIVFALTVRDLGFVGAIFITAMLASFASSKMTLVRALILSVCATIFTSLVFVKGLGLPFRLFGPWLGQ